MAKTETIRARIEPELKEQGDAVLSAIGLNTTEVIRMLYRQIVMRQGLPFDARIPTQTTIDAINEDVSQAKRYTSIDELMGDLDDDT